MRVSVCITTFRRPESFTRAVRSVFAQVGLAEMDVELVLVDNSPEGSAINVIRALMRNAPALVRAGHERRVGQAFARRAALKLATGDLIAWLDEDQQASPLWLTRFLEAQRELRADIVFGPIAPEGLAGPHAAYFNAQFERDGVQRNARLDAPMGLANSLMVRARALRSDQAFAMGEAHFFEECAARGLSLGWATGAWVAHHVDPVRATLRYAARNAFRDGQRACERDAREGKRLSVLRRMAVGSVEAAFFGISGAMALVFKTGRAVPLMSRAAKGAGQVFWFADARAEEAAAQAA
ncbi:MAG: glycosyltransferase family 2 protein [Hyphomonadaceae bacterium]